MSRNKHPLSRKKRNLQNDTRIKAGIDRFDSGVYTTEFFSSVVYTRRVGE